MMKNKLYKRWLTTK